MVKMDGTAFWVHLEETAAQDTNGAPVCRIVLSDITERKRAEDKLHRNESRFRRLVDILQHPSETMQEFLDYALDQAIQLTESKIGYIYHYHEDRNEFVLNTWSKEVMAACAVPNPPVCYDLDKTGIWGEAIRQRRSIIVNDFKAVHPLKKGYPEGHVQLLKFMTVPIFKGNRIVGVVGLANKETDYEETDVLQTSLLMEAVWKVTEGKRAEEALRESENKYRELSIVDGLTQLYNSRYFYHQLKMEMDRADRYGHPLTLTASRSRRFQTVQRCLRPYRGRRGLDATRPGGETMSAPD